MTLNSSIKTAILTIFCIVFSSCDSSGSKTSLVNLNIKANSNIEEGSSYQNSKTDISIEYSSLPFNDDDGGVLRDAVAYLDIDDDADTDIFVATGQFLLEGEVDSQLFINDGSNNFTLNNTLFNGDVAQATHARKSIVADFNNNGRMDIFVFDHGFDQDPFPGSLPKLIINNGTSLSWKKLKAQQGFHHGGAAADIDNDGDIDIFVGGFSPFFFINDGNANFTKVNDRFDSSIKKIFSAELIDIDKDGYIDLIVGAHEQDGDNTSIYWGSSKGSYSKDLRSILPAVKNYGTVLDFEAEDLDGDGEKDIVINRTGGGNNNFYIGRRIQILKNNSDRTFTDKTSKVSNPGGDNDPWITWFRAQDIDNDGDIDIFSDDRSDNILYLNDGSGSFVLTDFSGMPVNDISP